ncbi:MAG: ribosome-binding factor A [Cryomorphaceae bacterium]|jgi:ribosome-binding factor A|nr:ribosome-binding factor A [Cryomorphaceae bacterium]
MESIRQKRINALLQHDLADVFRALAAAEFPGTLISVSKVRVTPDLGLMRAYLSIFPIDRTQSVMAYINEEAPRIKNELAGRVRHQLRVIPNLQYFADDSIEYEANIDRLLREGGENPIK